MSTHQSHIKSRALEMFRSGQGTDCVIEVVAQTQMNGQDPKIKVFVLSLLLHSSRLCQLCEKFQS
jgi:hypothetical protein